ncbi:MAG: hypothetical protein COT38_05730 [Candidatus Omnitrophica bacterium CG08_land_8_20_14_0_20_41_16]|nr:MAG: hypothetical protein COT38_05730 [Candidatus Omnitrophica bacterium CG08_land_8_20_14_0_20_41_16]
MAPALVGRLLANAMRVRLGLRLGLGGGSPSRSVLALSSADTQKNYSVFNNGSSTMPHLTNKKLGSAACRASRTQGFRPLRGENFCPHQKFYQVIANKNDKSESVGGILKKKALSQNP